MKTSERKKHWENVFETKNTTKVSWYQSIPETSLKLIDKLELSKTVKIIEVGSGDSFLGDFLLEKGYSDITLLDISERALANIRNRLSEKDEKVTYITGDVTNFSTSRSYDIWHDRAVFHFITDKKDIQNYVRNVSDKLIAGGYLIIGTFSNIGPNECSGLKVQQYSENQLTEIFSNGFKKIECFSENHETPSGASQNFLFCVFQKN